MCVGGGGGGGGGLYSASLAPCILNSRVTAAILFKSSQMGAKMIEGD